MNAPATTDETKEALYERAKELDIEGRSDMDKDELADAVAKAESEQRAAERSPLRPEVGSPLSTGPVPSTAPDAIKAPDERVGGGLAPARRSAAQIGSKIKDKRKAAGRDAERGARS